MIMCGGLLEHLCFTFFNGILSNAINRNCSFIHTAHVWYGLVWYGMAERQMKIKEKESKVGTAVHTHTSTPPSAFTSSAPAEESIPTRPEKNKGVTRLSAH